MSSCCQLDERRDAVRSMSGRNGLDYVEVSNDQFTLTAYFLGKLPPEFHTDPLQRASYLSIEGGQRVTGIRIKQVTPEFNPNPELDDVLRIQLDRYGDFSTYTLRLVNVANIDPHYDHVDFSFKVNCPADLDCSAPKPCEPEPVNEPDNNYLAKDYASFRQLVLDRLAVVMPQWKEQHVPDIGVALVELLAYTGDYLSYYQDAVATEAYLDTCRQRISVRRLARLVDYRLHEGCDARAWVCIGVDQDMQLPTGSAFVTGLNETLGDRRTQLTWDDLARLGTTDAYEVFEPIATAPIQLWQAHNTMLFYTWGLNECCLVRGSTSASLLDSWTGDQARALDHLAPGDVLLFEEVIGPGTGLVADADPTHRQAVRLVAVTRTVDPVIQDTQGRATPVVDIVWAAEDALQFPFCISKLGPAPACNYLSNISVVRGNVVLVDHGQTQPAEALGVVPTLNTHAICDCVHQPGDVQVLAARIAPTLKGIPLTYRQPLPLDQAAAQQWVPASALVTQDVRCAVPQVSLDSQPPKPWQVHFDLLESAPDAWHFVVEVDNQAGAHLRFGDGTLGAQPPAGMQITATYRIGNGTAGNVGAESINRVVLANPLYGTQLRVRNPLPARGGTDPEPMAEAKLYAPHLFRTRIERAIAAEDYEVIAERNPKLQSASAQLAWSGSWYEADVAVDPLGSEQPPPTLLKDVRHYLEAYRRLGHDLAVTRARYVPLQLELQVCALPQYERAHVKAALLDVFSNRRLRDGKLGFFHPDQLSFGEGIYLSKIIAAAQAVEGVECVVITVFHRLFTHPNGELQNGILPLAHWEIAQLDNDPNFPERGKLVIQVLGGR